MIELFSYYYRQPVSSKYETFEDAAIAAVYEVEFNFAYPYEIKDGHDVLWQRSQTMEPLEQIAIKAGVRGFLGFD